MSNNKPENTPSPVMTPRERCRRCMHFQPVVRIPHMEFGGLRHGWMRGIILCLPHEVHAGSDPVTMRKEYGKELLFIGGSRFLPVTF